MKSRWLIRVMTGVVGALLVLAFWPPLLPSAAQDEKQIAPGELVMGEIVENGVNVWEIEAEAGAVVVMELQSDDFDPVLNLLADEAEFGDDDSGIGNDAYLITPPLPAAETYQAVVSAAFSGESGVYWLRYELLTPQAAGELPVGTLVAGEMGTANLDVWNFAGTAGQNLRVAVTSADQDLLARLFIEGADEIAADDDSGGDLNPLISATELPEDADYSLAILPAVDVDISGSIYVIETLSNLDALLYESDAIGRGVLPGIVTFVATEGQNLRIMARGDEIDVTLSILDRDARVLAADDDSGVDFGAAALDFMVPADGEYQLLVESFGSDLGLFSWRITGLGSGEDMPESEAAE